MGSEMKITKKNFIFLEIVLFTIGFLFLWNLKMEYDDLLTKSHTLQEKVTKLTQEKSFTLPQNVDVLYKKMFESNLSSNNIIPELQTLLSKLSIKNGVIIQDTKIKKLDRNIFEFVLKINAHDDRKIYNFLNEIENITQTLIISKTLKIQKLIKIEGEYHFEVHTKP
jgi:hypothetical protein